MGEIKIGNTTVNNIKLGNIQVQKVYLGDNLVWSFNNYSSELTAIINRANIEGFTLPSPSILTAMDSLILAYKNSGVWGKMDRLYNFACGRLSSNLIRFSENFDDTSIWSRAAVTVSANTITTTAPDGSNTADKLIENASNTSHLLTQIITSNPSTNYTMSIYVKAAEKNQIVINFSDGLVGKIRTFTLTGATGTVNDNTDATITNVGNGWYRCTISRITGLSTSLQMQLYMQNGAYLGDGVSGFYLWGAQIELGTTPTTYNRTPNTILQNFARIEWKNPISNPLLTVNGGMTFEESGFKGNGVDGYLGTGFIPATHGINYTQNNASRTSLVYQLPTLGNALDGNTPTGNNSFFIASSSSHRINTTNNITGGNVNLGGVGLKSINRDNSTALRFYNRTTESIRTATSTTYPTIEQFVFRSVSNYSNHIASNYMIGASITSGETISIRNDYNTYLSTIGLNPITLI